MSCVVPLDKKLDHGLIQQHQMMRSIYQAELEDDQMMTGLIDLTKTVKDQPQMMTKRLLLYVAMTVEL
jgi:hypothetical protein